eukprot:105231_1
MYTAKPRRRGGNRTKTTPEIQQAHNYFKPFVKRLAKIYLQTKDYKATDQLLHKWSKIFAQAYKGSIKNANVSAKRSLTRELEYVIYELTQYKPLNYNPNVVPTPHIQQYPIPQITTPHIQQYPIPQITTPHIQQYPIPQITTPHIPNIVISIPTHITTNIPTSIPPSISNISPVKPNHLMTVMDGLRLDDFEDTQNYFQFPTQIMKNNKPNIELKPCMCCKMERDNMYNTLKCNFKFSKICSDHDGIVCLSGISKYYKYDKKCCKYCDMYMDTHDSNNTIKIFDINYASSMMKINGQLCLYDTLNKTWKTFDCISSIPNFKDIAEYNICRKPRYGFVNYTSHFIDGREIQASILRVENINTGALLQTNICDDAYAEELAKKCDKEFAWENFEKLNTIIDKVLKPKNSLLTIPGDSILAVNYEHLLPRSTKVSLSILNRSFRALPTDTRETFINMCREKNVKCPLDSLT